LAIHIIQAEAILMILYASLVFDVMI